MTESWQQALQAEDVNTRATTVSQLGNVPAELREPLFQIVAADTCKEIRLAAAQLILLCPTAYQYFLGDQDPKVQTVIAASSVEIRRLHPDPASVIAVFTNANYYQAVATGVRYAIASVLAEHAKLEPRPAADKTLALIVPVIERFIRDPEDSVRVAVSTSVKEIAKVFGIEFVISGLTTPFHRMLYDPQWRVRLNAIELLFGLSVTSSLAFFSENLVAFIKDFLKDPISRVRLFTLSGLPTLVDRFGTGWLTTRLLPELEELAASPNYLHRETFVMSLSKLAKYFPERRLGNLLFRPLIKLLTDGVNSVVVLALVILSEHSAKLHPFRVQVELRPIVEGLVAGGAPTVKEVAKIFLQRLPT
jgi:HEAT repeat protein